MNEKTVEMVEKIRTSKEAYRNGIKITRIEIIRIETAKGVNRDNMERIAMTMEDGRTLLLTEAEFWKGSYMLK